MHLAICLDFLSRDFAKHYLFFIVGYPDRKRGFSLGHQQKLRQRELVWSGPTSGAVRRLTLPVGGLVECYRSSFFRIPT